MLSLTPTRLEITSEIITHEQCHRDEIDSLSKSLGTEGAKRNNREKVLELAHGWTNYASPQNNRSEDNTEKNRNSSKSWAEIKAKNYNNRQLLRPCDPYCIIPLFKLLTLKYKNSTKFAGIVYIVEFALVIVSTPCHLQGYIWIPSRNAQCSHILSNYFAHLESGYFAWVQVILPW